jgi:iron transport multicopper oxidase
LVVHDHLNPYRHKFDEEIVMTVSDWYHDESANLLAQFSAPGTPPDAVPIPYSALINDAQNTQFKIKPGKTYMVRAINIGAMAGIVLHFDQHNMTIVEIDGVYTQELTTDQIVLAPAQRYSFLIKAKKNADKNFAFLASMFTEQLPPNLPDSFQQNVTGFLVYDSKKPLPGPDTVDTFTPLDDFSIVPFDKKPILSDVDHRITLDFAFTSINGIPR